MNPLHFYLISLRPTLILLHRLCLDFPRGLVRLYFLTEYLCESLTFTTQSMYRSRLILRDLIVLLILREE
jgi:hypothetical protein